MLGLLKARDLGDPIALSLDDLVPPGNSYRHLERSLDLVFVRDHVRARYAAIGRPSFDPLIPFKLQLILFFEGLRSERQLMRVEADRLSVRWYLGYGPTRARRDLRVDRVGFNISESGRPAAGGRAAVGSR